MDALHAKYPFFEAAREAVAGASASLPTLVAEDAPAVERARERVERALLEGTAEPESGAFDGSESGDVARAELLSYPIARILVSLLDSEPAIEKYAAAEAATALDRIRSDIETDDELRSTSRPTVDLDEVLAEFDLADAVRAEPTRGGRDPVYYWIDVGAYLRFTSPSWGESWRLVNRALSNGDVRVSREELLEALGAAVEERVREGLPFDLEAGEGIAADLESRVAELKRLLSERTYTAPVDVVAPALFPPCMTNLIEKAERDVTLSPPESFALMAFLVGIGMTPDEVVAFCADTSLDAEGIRYQTEYLHDDRGTQYPPPTCETLANYGICHNEDDHMRVAADPLSYYETRVEEADEVTDWREQHGSDTDGADGTDSTGGGKPEAVEE
ncbi:DNA primase large subunit [Halorubrum alkaliphilum]|uniref:DNA primase large subunit PriL n=1 Tax=Halorubrum alkaliphilum TaxID=261290 RepID=A0A8T4GE86_9EURY|nr:DNA primase [Halorubrum alkaliphilum]MBP1921781.1 DNA primase large subunit [Halorubrum alkaliphilum]